MLSIVIAAWNGTSSLQSCLQSLANQSDLTDVEVIVVSNFDIGRAREILDSLPQSKATLGSADATVPELRAAGIEQSRGDIVALLEDHCTCDREWAAQIKGAHELPYFIIGGSVENSKDQMPLGWAVYFYDYGKYMLPDCPRVASTLSGNNVSYKRSVLAQLHEKYRGGFYETFVNEELQRSGYQLYLAPSAIVYHNKNYRLSRAVAESYHHGRAYAAKRVVGARLPQRLFRSATAVLLPAVLPARILIRTVRKQRHLRQLAMALPYVILLMTAWSYGEFLGYIWQEGRSARMWR